MINEKVKMKRVLVTGGAGFIGNHVAMNLIEKGMRPIIIDNFNDYYDPELKEVRIKRLPNDSFDLVRGDISDYPVMDELFDRFQPDSVIHLAAQAGVRYSLTNPFVYEQSNMLGTLNLLELCRHKKIKRFIFASSSSVYGKNKKIPFSETDNVDIPISLYAATKKANELYAHTYHHLYGIECIGLRFFTVYGPWGRPDMAAWLFADAITDNKPIDVYNFGKMKRDFTFVNDIVKGVVACLDAPLESGYEIINLGNHKSVELMRFIEIIEENLNKKAEKNMMEIQPGDVPETFADTEKARKILGFVPNTSIEYGIEKFIEWFKIWKNGNNKI